MAEKLNRGAVVHCPLCKVRQDCPVEDFVVPGRIGLSSEQEHECEDCHAYFTVICVAPDQYEVLAI